MKDLPRPRWLLPRLFLALQRLGLERIERSSTDTVRALIKRQPAKWMREFLVHDPEADLRRIQCPVLAITGRKDLQVDPEDIARAGALVSGRFTGETPAKLTHVLREVEGAGGLLSYSSQMKHPVEPALLHRVSTWIANELNTTPRT